MLGDGYDDEADGFGVCTAHRAHKRQSLEMSASVWGMVLWTSIGALHSSCVLCFSKESSRAVVP
jgi:hypothetical protein